MTSEARSAGSNQVERSSWTPVDAETVSRSLQALIETAAEQGRDYKLIDAIFLTLTAFIAESGEDVLAPSDSASSTRRLRPRYRARIEAVIDSLSDDEVSDFLSIGTRQVRRLAQMNELYCFVVGKRRRYPAWQFDEHLGVLPGLRDVVQEIPKDWSPERVRSFLTTLKTGLKVHGESIAPRTWLIVGLDPVRISKLMQDEAETDEEAI